MESKELEHWRRFVAKIRKSVEKRFQSGPRQILVAGEKHGDRLLDATTPEALQRSALGLLRERLRDCWYSVRTPPGAPEINEGEIDKLPEFLRPEARRAWKNYENQLEGFREDKFFSDRVRMAIEENDGYAALALLQERSDTGHGYEKVTIEPLEDFR